MQKSIRLVSGLYIKLALLTAAVGFALRIVLLFRPASLPPVQRKMALA